MHRVLRGSAARDDAMHLTLAFIGDVGVDKVARLLAPPEAMAPAFTLRLDDWGCWARNGIGWMAPSHSPAALRDLAANLQAWLRSIGFALEHRAFTPHVTLIRKAQCAPLPAPLAPIEWQVSEFALIRSRLAPTGASYEIMRTWPLERQDGV
jgi:2'-5' RNA ligase